MFISAISIPSPLALGLILPDNHVSMCHLSRDLVTLLPCPVAVISEYSFLEIYFTTWLRTLRISGVDWPVGSLRVQALNVENFPRQRIGATGPQSGNIQGHLQRPVVIFVTNYSNVERQTSHPPWTPPAGPGARWAPSWWCSGTVCWPRLD